MIVGDIFSAPAMHPGLLLTCAGCRGSRVLAVFDIELALSCVFSPPEILEFSTEHDCIYLHDELPRRRVWSAGQCRGTSVRGRWCARGSRPTASA